MTTLQDYKQIIIWGASFPPSELESESTNTGRAIEKLRDLLDNENLMERVLFIVDSNKALQGRKRLHKEVCSPEKIRDYPDALVIINTISFRAIIKAMRNMGLRNDIRIIPYYFYHGTLEIPYSMADAYDTAVHHEDDIRSLYDTSDQITAQCIDIIMTMRKKNKDELYTLDDYKETGFPVDYFCDTELSPKGDVTYIDVGAYDGNSITPVRRFYGERLKKIIAFEPDSTSIPELRKYIDANGLNDKTVCYPYALGNEDKLIKFEKSGQLSMQTEDGTISIEQRIFDKLPDTEPIGDAMVKMDIEGAELGALSGMEGYIKKYTPYLAICIYHKAADIYELASYIRSLYQGYRLYIRGRLSEN
jgi:FkbM family methyltransferase